jgi:hypothetical protein
MFLKGSFGLHVECLLTLFTNSVHKLRSGTAFYQFLSQTLFALVCTQLKVSRQTLLFEVYRFAAEHQMFAKTVFPSKKKILARNFPHTPGCGTVCEPCCPWSVQKINVLSNLIVDALR